MAVWFDVYNFSTRQRYEKELGRKIISPTNASNKKLLEVKNKKDDE